VSVGCDIIIIINYNTLRLTRRTGAGCDRVHFRAFRPSPRCRLCPRQCDASRPCNVFVVAVVINDVRASGYGKYNNLANSDRRVSLTCAARGRRWSRVNHLPSPSRIVRVCHNRGGTCNGSSLLEIASNSSRYCTS